MMLQSPETQSYVGPGRPSEEYTPLVRGARQRRGETPFRDDPFGPRVQMEPAVPKKSLSMPKRILNGCSDCMRGVCSNASGNSDGKPAAAFYRDDFNDSPWSCRVGTTEEHGIWMNLSDQAGTIMALLVWLLLMYSALTVTFLARTGGIHVSLSYMYSILCSFALAAHAKTQLTDPGTVPASAVPTEEQRKQAKLSMCSQCQTFKPHYSHHCRICNRCIARMDHHCPWMNNCIGAGNMKHFCLFLVYTWSCSVFSLALLGWNYFFCTDDECMFNPVLTQLVRVMTLLGVGTFLFTSSMLMNVSYGLLTGIGTIDRLKKKATNTLHISDDEPIPLSDVFGIGPYWQWPLPVDPLFDDHDRIMGYSTPQRLLREQLMTNPNHDAGAMYPPSVISNYTPV